MPSRRDLLRVCGTAGLAALAGCSRLPLVPGPQLSLTLRNKIEQAVEVSVELIRANGEEYSEAIAYDERLELPAPAEQTGAPGRRTVPDVAPAQPYRVRVRFGDSFGTPAADYRYYPDCAAGIADDDSLGPRLFIVLARDDDTATVRVRQTRCTENAVWY
jgi:hypothetical protein